MDQILNEITASGFDISSFLTAALVFAAGSVILGFLCRMLFGEDSPMSNAISSAIGILFIYFATVAVLIIGGELEQFRQCLSPLPFVTIEGEQIQFFIIGAAAHQEVCQQILSMLILAFLVNLLDTWFPRGNHVIVWFFNLTIT